MALSSDLIAKFVKANKDDKAKTDTIVYGTVVKQGTSTYVQFDGSDLLTPVSATADTHSGERVTVMIKNHNAIITGNISSPAARVDDITDVTEVKDTIKEFEILMGYKITVEDLSAVNATINSLIGKSADLVNVIAITAELENLRAMYAQLEYVYADDVEALNAAIENIEATFGKIADLSTEKLEAINADINNLRGYNASFTYIEADVLHALYAAIEELEAKKLSTTDAEIKYANIDFSNIGQAAMEYLYSKSGLIENVIIGDGSITGLLVGVTIKGDIIEGNTIVADKLVIQGDDGLYYKLNMSGETISAEQTEYNSLNGSIILAKSITAEKMAVDDLVAFDATIGGFHITEDAIYSEVKDSDGNTTRGTYLDKEGQVNFGDSENFVKYYRDDNGNYHLAISAETIMYNINGQQRSIADLGVIGEYVKISTYEGEPCIELGESDSDFKLVITNTRIMFMEGNDLPAYINNKSLFIKKAVIEEELEQGGFIWKARSNGNLGLIWKGVNN